VHKATADAVVVSVPHGCLREGDIAFKPPLPQWKQRAIDGLATGLCNRVVLVFPQSFWEDVGRALGDHDAAKAATGGGLVDGGDARITASSTAAATTTTTTAATTTAAAKGRGKRGKKGQRSPPPQRQQRSQQQASPGVGRGVARAVECFGRLAALGCEDRADSVVLQCHAAGLWGVPVLSAVMAGGAAEDLEMDNDRAVVQAVMRKLQRMFQKTPTSTLAATTTTTTTTATATTTPTATAATTGATATGTRSGAFAGVKVDVPPPLACVNASVERGGGRIRMVGAGQRARGGRRDGGGRAASVPFSTSSVAGLLCRRGPRCVICSNRLRRAVP
jgi:hypothetical protein